VTQHVLVVVELDFSLLERGGTCATFNETGEMDEEERRRSVAPQLG
jgi:hypothetical protein